MAIYYSQETRAYAQLTLMLALTYACISKALTSGGAAWWVGAAVAATAALYTHYLAALALVFSVALVAARPSPAAWRGITFVGAAAALAFAPWGLAVSTRTRSGASGLEWIATLWQQTPPSLAIPRSLEVLMLGGHSGPLLANFKQLTQIDFPPSLQLLGVSALAVLALIALASDGEGGDREAVRWKWALVVLIVGPLGLLWSLSWWQPLYVVGRYDQIALPAYPLLLALACSRLQAWRGNLVAILMAALLLVPIGVRLWLYYGAAPRDLESRAAAFLDARAGDGDVFIFTEMRALPALYELSRLGYRFADATCTNVAAHRRFACRAYPHESEQLQGMSDNRAPHDTAQVAADFADDRAGEGNSVWIVFGRYRVSGTRLEATRVGAGLLKELEALGLKPVSADVDTGTLQYGAAR
jgi:hypothetical protein